MAYSDTQVERLQEFDEVTYLQAVDLGVELGYSTKSVISKVQSLKIPYVRKEVPAPKPPVATKAEIVTDIEATLGADLTGLSNATVGSLNALLDAVTEA